MSESTTLQPFVKVVVSEAKERYNTGTSCTESRQGCRVTTAGTLREMTCVLRIMADSSTHGFPSFEDDVGLSGLN